MLKVLNERIRMTWVSYIRCMLGTYGFNFVWISQGLGDIDISMELFKTKPQEHFKNTKFADLENVSKLATYLTFSREFEPERY